MAVRKKRVAVSKRASPLLSASPALDSTTSSSTSSTHRTSSSTPSSSSSSSSLPSSSSSSLTSSSFSIPPSSSSSLIPNTNNSLLKDKKKGRKRKTESLDVEFLNTLKRVQMDHLKYKELSEFDDILTESLIDRVCFFFSFLFHIHIYINIQIYQQNNQHYPSFLPPFNSKIFTFYYLVTIFFY